MTGSIASRGSPNFAVSTTVILTAVFLAIGGFREPTINQLAVLNLDPLMLETVPAAFARYVVWVCFAVVWLVVAGNFIDKRLLQTALAKKEQLLQATFIFFLFYVVLTRALQFPVSGDDSYIDYRYVHNWVNGISFDYNPGERVIGFTSNLHLCLLTVVAFLTRVSDISLVSQNINVFLQLINYVLVYHLFSLLTQSRSRGVLAAVVYALLPYNVTETAFGKETSLVQMLMIIALMAMHKGRNGLFAWMAALLVLARPEGVLWFATSFFWSFKNQKRAAIKYWIAPVLLLLAFFGAMYLYFGTVLPHGMLAKAKCFYPRPPYLGALLSVMRLGFGTLAPDFRFFIPQGFFSDAVIYMAQLGGTLTLLALLRFIRQTEFRFYVLNVIVYVLFYSLSNPFLFEWYLCWLSLVPPLMVTELCLRLRGVIAERKTKQDVWVAYCCLAYLALVQVSEPVLRRHVIGLPTLCFYWNDSLERLVIYRRAVEALNSRGPGKVLAVPELGMCGYSYNGYILDLDGLISPQVMPYLPPPLSAQYKGGLYSIPPRAIAELKPDFIVTDGSFSHGGLMKEKNFLEDYRLFGFVPFTLWSDGIYTFERNRK